MLPDTIRGPSSNNDRFQNAAPDAGGVCGTVALTQGPDPDRHAGESQEAGGGGVKEGEGVRRGLLPYHARGSTSESHRMVQHFSCTARRARSIAALLFPSRATEIMQPGSVAGAAEQVVTVPDDTCSSNNVLSLCTRESTVLLCNRRAAPYLAAAGNQFAVLTEPWSSAAALAHSTPSRILPGTLHQRLSSADIDEVMCLPRIAHPYPSLALRRTLESRFSAHGSHLGKMKALWILWPRSCWLAASLS